LGELRLEIEEPPWVGSSLHVVLTQYCSIAGISSLVSPCVIRPRMKALGSLVD
jgi:hypothetical protein